VYVLIVNEGIENLFVYGNEYVEVSAAKADAVMSNVAPAHGQKGVICPGDSGNLYFVPSDAFDLVYTGYLRYVTTNLGQVIVCFFYVDGGTHFCLRVRTM
jgi:hypothetical protein